MKWTGCKFYLYEDIRRVKNISELLNPYSLILYQLADVGHFCVVFRDGRGYLNFFDPIGTIIDGELRYIANGYHPNNHDYPYLFRLFANSNEDVIYNQYKYQRPDSSVCGYWCALRLLNHNMSCDAFHENFKNFVMRDKKIVKLVNNIVM